MIPLSLARHAAEKIIISTADLIRAVYFIAWPVRALGFIDVAIRRLAAEHVTEQEDIKDELAVRRGGRRRTRAALGEDGRDMIEAVVEFGSTTSGQIMTPRTDVEALELTDDLGMVIKAVRELNHRASPSTRARSTTSSGSST